MKKITSLLSRYAHLAPPGGGVREAVVVFLKERLGINVPLTHISLERGSIFLKVSPTVKNEIYFLKATLLDSLKKEFGARAPRDIR